MNALTAFAIAHVEASPLELAVVIPTLNERDNIVPLLAGLDRSLAGLEWEAIFVDDGSTDGTQAVVEALAERRRNVRLIRRYGRRGLASAIVEGMMATVAPMIACIDADRQHDEAILPDLYRALLAGADIAVGTRYAQSGSTGDWDARRVRKSAIATSLAGMVLRTPVSDPMSGFFAVRRATLLEAVPHLSNVGFKILLDLIASSPAPLKLAEVPYTFRERTAGASKLDSLVTLEYLLLLLDKLIGGVVPPRLIMFIGVGAAGLVVNLMAIGLLLKGVGLDYRNAQAIAVALSILFNFSLNNLLTYHDRRLQGADWWRGLIIFSLVCAFGALAQVGVGSMIYETRHAWWIAGLAGAAVGAVWNYAVTGFLTWRRR